MEKLKIFLEKQGFSGTALDQIAAAFVRRDFKKFDLFVSQGQAVDQIGFIESGMFQYYTLEQETETTTYIAIENSFIASVFGFFSEVPAPENIRALMNGQVWMISREAISRLIREVTGFKDFYINMLEWHICAMESSRNDLLRLTAEQRYTKLLQTTPRLLDYVPLQYLAAMLGVTPRHLSRLRKNLP